MNTFSDKPLFTLKQLIGSIVTAAAIGGGIARFEIKTSSIENKLDTIIASVENTKIEDDKRFSKLEVGLLANNDKLQAVTTSLTALLKPEDVELKKR